MVIITIQKADLSPYWKESFNDRASAEKWLGEEKLRPYWDETFVVTIDDKTAEEQQSRDSAFLEIQVKNNRRAQLASDIKTLFDNKVRTLTETNTMVDKIALLLRTLF